MIHYLKMFFAEKEIPYKSWEIVDANGVPNFIDNEVVIEHIKVTSTEEQNQIADVLRKIDFANGDVNHFFEHLAKGLVMQRSMA